MRDGVLIVNKPKGITSTRVVERVKRKLKTKVGHTGTLDPIATGVLVLLIGKATRFSWLFLNMEKIYRVTALLGVSTDTYDIEGNVLKRSEVDVRCEEIEELLSTFRGSIEQFPPPFSAKKIEGKRAYKLARKGIRPKLKPIRALFTSLRWKNVNHPR